VSLAMIEFNPPRSSFSRASVRPPGRLHLDRRIDFSAICLGMLLHVVVAEIEVTGLSCRDG
jgi:hypothetical protein